MQQPNSRKTLLHTSGAIFFIRFFPTLANLLVILYFSRQLSLETYGQYQHIWAQYYLISAVALVGLPAFALTVGAGPMLQLIRSWPARRRGLLLVWPIFWSAVFGILQHYSGFMGIGLAFFFMVSAVTGMAQEGLLLAARSFRLLVWVNFGYTLLFLYLHWFFLAGAKDLNWLFAALSGLNTLRILLLIAALMPMIRARSVLQEKLPAGVGKLWLHLGFYELMQMVFRWADKFLVSLFLSAGAMAVYFNGSLEIPFLPILLGAAGGALLLQMQDNGAEQGLAGKTALVRQSAVVLSSIVLPLFFFLLFFARPLFRVALSEKYLVALPVFWVMLLILPLRAYNFTTLLQHLHKGWLINAGALLDILLALGLAYPMYQWLGLPGITLSFVVATYTQAMFYVYFIRKTTGVKLLQIIPLVNWLAKAGGLLLLFAAFRYLSLRFDTPAGQLMPAAAALILSMALLLYLDFRQLKRK